MPDHQRFGHDVQHDDVLAQVMFGMRKDLLPNHTPEASGTIYKNINRERIWVEALQFAFPYVSDTDGATTFWRVTDLHRLRNRVSHLEPVFDEDLPFLMREAFGLMKSIEPVVADWDSNFNRIPDLLKARPY